MTNVITDPQTLKNYQSDESSAFQGTATELYIPKTEAELIAVLSQLSQNQTLITISGGGTGITGSRCPVDGGAVISVEALTAPAQPCPPGYTAINEQGFTLYLNSEERLAICPPSIPLSVLDSILAPHHLLYPLDPTEMSAQLGGTVATNASGARSFFYGPTRQWIQALRVILVNGAIIQLKRGHTMSQNQVLKIPVNDGESSIQIPLPKQSDYPMPAIKHAAGLYLKPDMDAIDLFIGSEGILGVITDITVRLAERIPKKLTVVAFFNTEKDALNFVDSGIQHTSSQVFLSLEYFDRHALDMMRKSFPDTPAAEAAVLFEVAYSDNPDNGLYPPRDQLQHITQDLARFNAVSNWTIPWPNQEDIRLFRHSLPEAVNDYVRSRTGKIGTDMAVPHARLNDLMLLYTEVSEEAGVPYVKFGHIGNDHLHVNYLPDDSEGAKRAKLGVAKLARAVVAWGGSVSAEHGVGKKQVLMENHTAIPWLEVQYGPKGLAIIAEIKTVLDPKHLLNVGNMIRRVR